MTHAACAPVAQTASPPARPGNAPTAPFPEAAPCA